MSLLKPRLMTPARLAANRCNAQKSTGPRTARGKRQVRMNGLRNGRRSRLYCQFMLALLSASPGAVDRVARVLLTPDLARQPSFAEFAELAIATEAALTGHTPARLYRGRAAKKDFYDQTREITENKGRADKSTRKNGLLSRISTLRARYKTVIAPSGHVICSWEPPTALHFAHFGHSPYMAGRRQPVWSIGYRRPGTADVGVAQARPIGINQCDPVPLPTAIDRKPLRGFLHHLGAQPHLWDTLSPRGEGRALLLLPWEEGG